MISDAIQSVDVYASCMPQDALVKYLFNIDGTRYTLRKVLALYVMGSTLF